MNANKVAGFIHQPDSIKAMDLEGLNELCSQYPYTQLFSILYLKGLSKEGSIHFEDELQKHSYRISDRKQLYFLINDYQSTEPLVEIADDKNGAERSIEANQYDSEIEEATKEVIVVETNEDEIQQSEGNPEEEIIDNKNHEEEQLEDPLDIVIREQAMIHNYVLEELSEAELKSLEERNLEKEQINASEELEEEVVELPTLHIDEKQTFTSWLTSDKNYHENLNVDQQAIRSIVEGFEEFDPTQKLYGETEKPKKEFFSPIKKAKESLQEEGLPVSETLAKIYALQGNYPKAIHAYQQLSLKYPEKKVFFANLISELEKKINN